MRISYVLLGLAICAVWLPSISLGRTRRLPPWVALFIAAIIAGLVTKTLEPPALLWLGALSLAAWGSLRQTRPVWSVVLHLLSATIALALAMHALPGFNNTPLYSAARISLDATSFTQYLNFDKGAAGLILLATYAQRCKTWPALQAMLTGSAIVILLTAACVLGLAVLMGYAKFDLKLPEIALGFLVTNLVFTCVAEEAFFRGLVQERLHTAIASLASQSVAAWLPVLVSALIFGLAHAHGGPSLVLLSIVAGLGYAIAYAKTRRIEAAILTHFFVNAVHFIGFTYPRLM